MPNTTLPLDDLTQQIAQRQSELERLRQEFETRRTRLSDLEGRREQLRAQLQQVEADIQAVIQGSTHATAEPTAPQTPATPAPPTEAATHPTLAEALTDVVRAARRPLTAKDLAEELVRRQYPTASSNFPKQVQKRLRELVQRGVFQRAQGQPGVVLAAANNEAPASAPKAAPAARVPGQPSLRSVLTALLQKSRKPITLRDLAARVLATGYQTSSKNFANVVKSALSDMEGIENVKGQGWRLKKVKKA